MKPKEKLKLILKKLKVLRKMLHNSRDQEKFCDKNSCTLVETSKAKTQKLKKERMLTSAKSKI